MLEMIEYCLARTEAQEKAILSERPMRLRGILLIHRFQVMTWLLQAGVSIPPHLLADSCHPKPGCQSVDAPVETEPSTTE